MLIGDFGILAKNIYKRTRVKNSEILELLIYGAYIEEQSKLDEFENQIMYKDANYYYQQGQEEVNKTLKKKKVVSVMPDAIFLALMMMPNAKGYIWKEYIQATVKYNANQIYRQATIDLQQQKELDITNDIYQNLIKRQQNSRLNINGDKISGDIDLTLIGINNKAKQEGIYSFDKNAEVQFVSIEDAKTTKMCKSLDGQKFKVHGWNEFERYSDNNGRITKYRCYGLVVGLNCPPIDDHFHWCRSFIVYLQYIELEKKYSIFGNSLEKTVKDKYNVQRAKLKGLDKRALLNTLKNMDKVYRDFPQIKNKLKEINVIEHPNGGLNITPDIKDGKYIMEVNKKFYGDIDIVKKQYQNDVKNGFHPKNTTYEDLGNHELGHCVTFEIIKNKYTNKDLIIKDWNNDITTKEIVQKAFNNLGISDKMSQNLLRNNISTYARTKYSETIGEAFSDYYKNGNRASILSREIVKTMKGMI